MGVGHVPQDPIRPEGESADVQGRQRRGTSPARARAVTKTSIEKARIEKARIEKARAAQARGRFGEDEALRWYTQHGYALIARNWRCQAGEVDLILSRPIAVNKHVVNKHVLVFCEVKARASLEFGGPEGAVDWQKQRRLRRLAALWLAEFRPTGHFEVRFDVAAVVGARVTVIESAF